MRKILIAPPRNLSAASRVCVGCWVPAIALDRPCAGVATTAVYLTTRSLLRAKLSFEGPAEDDVHAIGEKVLGKGYDPMFDKNFFLRLLHYHPGFIPKREIFSAQFDGKAARVPSQCDGGGIGAGENR